MHVRWPPPDYEPPLLRWACRLFIVVVLVAVIIGTAYLISW
jgi:hypothetical protein